jgi:hypothetical protein
MKAGITGHQDIGDQATITWVKDTLARLVVEYKVSKGFTCLAQGADQLFAAVLAEKNIPFTAVISCLGYEKTFDEQAARNDYLRFVQMAGERIDLNFPHPSEQAFFEGGKKVVACSDIIFAVWNGKPARGLGGTGDVVNFSKQVGKSVVHVNPVTQKTTIL